MDIAFGVTILIVVLFSGWQFIKYQTAKQARERETKMRIAAGDVRDNELDLEPPEPEVDEQGVLFVTGNGTSKVNGNGKDKGRSIPRLRPLPEEIEELVLLPRLVDAFCRANKIRLALLAEAQECMREYESLLKSTDTLNFPSACGEPEHTAWLEQVRQGLLLGRRAKRKTFVASESYPLAARATLQRLDDLEHVVSFASAFNLADLQPEVQVAFDLGKRLLAFYPRSSEIISALRPSGCHIEEEPQKPNAEAEALCQKLEALSIKLVNTIRKCQRLTATVETLSAELNRKKRSGLILSPPQKPTESEVVALIQGAIDGAKNQIDGEVELSNHLAQLAAVVNELRDLRAQQFEIDTQLKLFKASEPVKRAPTEPALGALRVPAPGISLKSTRANPEADLAQVAEESATSTAVNTAVNTMNGQPTAIKRRRRVLTVSEVTPPSRYEPRDEYFVSDEAQAWREVSQRCSHEVTAVADMAKALESELEQYRLMRPAFVDQDNRKRVTVQAAMRRLGFAIAQLNSASAKLSAEVKTTEPLPQAPSLDITDGNTFLQAFCAYQARSREHDETVARHQERIHGLDKEQVPMRKTQCDSAAEALFQALDTNDLVEENELPLALLSTTRAARALLAHVKFVMRDSKRCLARAAEADRLRQEALERGLLAGREAERKQQEALELAQQKATARALFRRQYADRLGKEREELHKAAMKTVARRTEETRRKKKISWFAGPTAVIVASAERGERVVEVTRTVIKVMDAIITANYSIGRSSDNEVLIYDWVNEKGYEIYIDGKSTQDLQGKLKRGMCIWLEPKTITVLVFSERLAGGQIAVSVKPESTVNDVLETAGIKRAKNDSIVLHLDGESLIYSNEKVQDGSVLIVTSSSVGGEAATASRGGFCRW